ncbi:hypothetical protein UlMin_038570 [Ulmus minor]
MGASQKFSTLSFEVKIIQAKSVESISRGYLFVRCYLPAGGKKRIQLNTREIPTKSDHVWNDFFSLECSTGTESSIDLEHESLVLELRWRNTVPILGKIGGSKLLGRAEIPWKEVLESPNMVLDKWVSTVSSGNRVLEGIKPPKLQVVIGVGVPAKAETETARRRRSMAENWDECGCKDRHVFGCDNDEYDIFALTAAIELL